MQVTVEERLKGWKRERERKKEIVKKEETVEKERERELGVRDLVK